MGIFKIEGGIQLKGEITPQGAKNEALQILCAVLLTPEKVTINNIPDIIDINTGSVITGEKSISQMGEEILEFVLKVASGEIITKAMKLGQDDFIPWKRGVSL
ncbi:MAG: hypothetical protein EAZ58_01950 [Flavobacterium sp.]|nr:MAG: hypothetical protein EAZ58_01950 [Flavobacterium sp.]